MARISMTNLETLCHVARLGTFQAAADHLHTAQPTVSARMRELEARLGFPLFQKRGRNMDLTTQGRELVQRVEPLLSAIDDVILSLEDPAQATGLIRIGITEIVGYAWFPRFIEAARCLMPNVTYRVEVGHTFRAVERLREGKLDLLLLSAPIDPERFHTVSIGAVDMLWVGAPGLVGRDGAYSTEPWADLMRKHPVWSLSRESPLHPILMASIKAQDMRVRIDICNNVHTMVRLIAGGTGIGLLTRSLVETSLADGSLVLLKDAPALPRLRFSAAWSVDQGQTLVRKLVELATQTTTFLTD